MKKASKSAYLKKVLIEYAKRKNLVFSKKDCTYILITTLKDTFVGLFVDVRKVRKISVIEKESA